MEYESKDKLMGNEMVSGNHQTGIKRIMMRKGDLEMGRPAKMCGSPSEKSDFKRSDMSYTPRKA